MNTGGIFEPYAQALMTIAQQHDLAERIGEDVTALREVLSISPELSDCLVNPFVSGDAKKAILQQIAGDSFHTYTVNFLKLLIDRKRIVFLDGICERYQELLRKLTNTVLAEVTSAVELTEEQAQVVRDRVTAMTGATRVELSSTLDRDMIGGVTIQVGSQILDASLRGQLRRIALGLGAT
jgi:F-type H+-transporting ATPase subunit delta